MVTKILEVDWDNLDSLHDLRQRLNSRYHHLKREKESGPNKIERSLEIYDACMSIYFTDTSSLFDGSQNKEYYVYAHCFGNTPIESVKKAMKRNPKLAFAATVGITHAPFYIGKGKGNRAMCSERNRVHASFVEKADGDVVVNILYANLSEPEALSIESKLIDIFGLKIYGGMLSNLNEGSNVNERRTLYSEPFYDVLGKTYFADRTGVQSPRLHQKALK